MCARHATEQTSMGPYAGECASNSAYMEGDGYTLGACRCSCKLCEVCGGADAACRAANRARAGYLPQLLDENLE